MRFVGVLIVVASCKQPTRVEPPEATPLTVTGTFTGKLTVYPGFVSKLDESLKPVPPAPSAAQTTFAATADIYGLRQGNGAKLGELWLHSGDQNLKMEIVVLDDNIRITGVRPVSCGATATGGRIAATVMGDELHIDELSLENACPFGGVEARYLRFDGRRNKR